MKPFQIIALDYRSVTPVGEIIWVLASSEQEVRAIVMSVPELFNDERISSLMPTNVVLSDIDFILPQDLAKLKARLIWLWRGGLPGKRLQTVTYCDREDQLARLLEYCDDNHIDFTQPEAVPDPGNGADLAKAFERMEDRDNG